MRARSPFLVNGGRSRKERAQGRVCPVTKRERLFTGQRREFLLHDAHAVFEFVDCAFVVRDSLLD